MKIGLYTTFLLGIFAAALVLAQETPAPPTSPAPPENTPRAPAKKKRFHLEFGPQYSAFRPGTAKAGSRFGHSWGGVGLALGGVSPSKPGFQPDLDIDFLSGSSGKNRAYLVPLGAGGRYTFRTGSALLYIGAAGGLYGVNLRSDPEAVKAGWRFTGGGNLFTGVNLSRRVNAEARWYRVNPVRGFNLSGVNIAAGVRF